MNPHVRHLKIAIKGGTALPRIQTQEPMCLTLDPDNKHRTWHEARYLRFVKKGERGRKGYSFVARLSRLTFDHAFLLRRSTVPTPKSDTSNIEVHSTFLPFTTQELSTYLIPVLFRRQRGGEGNTLAVTPPQNMLNMFPSRMIHQFTQQPIESPAALRDYRVLHLVV